MPLTSKNPVNDLQTGAAAGFDTHPYRAHVPSFGEWGFVLAKKRPFDPPSSPGIDDLRFLTPEIMPSLFAFA